MAEHDASLQLWMEAGGASPEDVDAWHAELRAALRRARDEWPNLAVPDEEMIRVLARAVPANARDFRAALENLCLGDLYLARACALHLPDALEAFQVRCGEAIAGALGRFAPDGEFREEVEQVLNERLFVGTAESPPKIDGFVGSGSLPRWVKVAAVRLAVDRLRGRGRLEDPTSDAAMLDKMDPGVDPELAYLHKRYGDLFKQAVATALAELADSERRILREHLVFGLSTAQIGRLHGIHKATAARWIAAARDRIAARVREAVIGGEQLRGEDLDSVVRLVRSQLDLSLARLLSTR